MNSMHSIPQESSYLRLPIEPNDGFPQAFSLSLEDTLYLLTFSVSFLTLEPFKVWEAARHLHPEKMLQRSLSLPLRASGARIRLPWTLQGEPERMIYTLPQENLYLIVKAERQDLPDAERVLGITRPVLGIPVRVGNLEFLFKQIHIARGNLLGPGDYGSKIVAGVKTYGS